MGLIEKILTTSAIVAASGAIIHGVYEIVTSSEKLYNLPKSYKTKNAKVSHMSKSGTCRICGFQGYTEWHHIISRGHAMKTNQDDLIENPGNVVELCKTCHDQTTASKSWKHFQRKNN